MWTLMKQPLKYHPSNAWEDHMHSICLANFYSTHFTFLKNPSLSSPKSRWGYLLCASRNTVPLLLHMSQGCGNGLNTASSSNREALEGSDSNIFLVLSPGLKRVSCTLTGLTHFWNETLLPTPPKQIYNFK